jgi:hypothetical protein
VRRRPRQRQRAPPRPPRGVRPHQVLLLLCS